jgi:phosphate transport system substrate-binding protein
LILTPRNCRDAYAYWEVPEERKLELRGQGGRQLTLRLYEATGNSEPIFVSQIDCPELEQDQHIAIPVDDRNYLVELGYQTPEQAWLPIARSEVVHVPACPVTPAIVESLPPEANRIILTPRNCRQAYAYWEITPELQESLRLQGGQDLRLKVYEVDHPENAALYECSELDSDRQVPIPVDARDYIAELGYLTATGNWLSLARSLPVPVPPCVDEEIPTPGLLEETGELLSGLGVGAMGVVGAAGAAFGEVFNFAPAGSEAQITLTPQDSEQGLVTWDIPEALKVEARTLGGERLALRIYDLSDSNNNERPDSVREYDCAEFEQHKEVRFYAGDRYYAAELGYISREGRWLPLARSASVWIPNPETQPS